MAQKILAGRCSDPMLAGDFLTIKIDQVVLARVASRVVQEARELGLKKSPAEVAVVYDTFAIADGASTERGAERAQAHAELLAAGALLGRAGAGFASPVHLERFASPARLCVTDDPRLASNGGLGMLTLHVSPGQLAQALVQGSVLLRPPRSVQVNLSGRTRPFVCAKDVAFELVRRGIGDIVKKVEEAHRAPVVLEFGGASARLLSVYERAVLAALAPHVGAAGALFVSDERTEVFLRDQRRSKAHRALVPDAGAPFEEVMNVDLGGVDPLLGDETGAVRNVRDLAGKPVSQVILGGDASVTLRDMLAAAALLKSKKIPPRTDFLIAPPSRQMLEVMAQEGALEDLLACGARLIEPDARVLAGTAYPPPSSGVSLRSFDGEPGGPPAVVASAETLAYAVATGEVGDPRAFKRPVRVTVPRALPTDDVLMLRERKADASLTRKALSDASPTPFKGGTLDILDLAQAQKADAKGAALVCASLEELRAVSSRAAELSGAVRAVFAPMFPSQVVSLFSGLGIAAIAVDATHVKTLRAQKSVSLPVATQFFEVTGRAAAEGSGTSLAVGSQKIPVEWLAKGAERGWAMAGSSRPLKK